MHRALYLPEIVSTIPQTEVSSPGFLYTCLLVNNLFFLETCRILWDWYGDTLIGAPAGNPRPEVSHLSQIVNSNAKRGQIYANFIRKLSIGLESEDCEENEARWHSELMQLRYPKLEEVVFLDAHDGDRYLNTESVILHYMEPTLRGFAIEQRNANFSDQLLETLLRCCPSLPHLRLNTAGCNKITAEGLAVFLTSMTALTYLEILEGFEDVWSPVALQLSSTLPRLQLLALPEIEEDWIRSLTVLSPMPGTFPMLSYLRTELTVHTAKELLRVMPNIQYLQLCLRESVPLVKGGRSGLDTSDTLIPAAAQFRLLRSCKATFGEDDVVSGTDLLLLAQSCPELEELSLAQPDTVGITDDLVESLAQSLRSITEVTLKSRNEVSLTFKSLKHFGRYCKSLKQLYLSCSASWEREITPDTAGLFPNLWQLTLAPAKDGTNWHLRRSDSLQRTAECIVNIGPKLCSFNFKNPGVVELELLKLTQHTCNSRMYLATR